MNKVEAYLIQLNSEEKKFISAFDVSGREERVANTLDKLQSETKVSLDGIGVEVFNKQKQLVCFIIETVILFPSQEMQDLFTRTLFTTR